MLCGESHIGSVGLGLHHPRTQKELREGKGLMNAYSVMTRLLRPANEVSAALGGQQPILLPRTAADELPPYREQPWIIDKGGYRKIDASMTLVPVSRL
jgi:hypothetical protein